MGTLRHGNIVVFGCLFVAFIQCPRALLSHIHIQLLEYVIPTAPTPTPAPPKSPLCFGVSQCSGVNPCYGVSQYYGVSPSYGVRPMLWC